MDIFEVGLKRFEQRRLIDAIDSNLEREPLLETRRKKELTGLEPEWEAVPPIWQLRVGDFRVFYDVEREQRRVTIRAIRRKGSKTTEEIL